MSEEIEKQEGKAAGEGYTDFEYICIEIENGLAARKAIKAFGMDNKRFYKLLNESKANRERYARACEARAETIFEDILDISDDSSNDTFTDENGVERTNNEVIARSRLRVDARKWMLSKLQPKKYGDKLEVDANVKGEIQTVTVFKLPDNGR